MADNLSPARRRWNMRRIRSSSTGPERLMRRAMQRWGESPTCNCHSLPGTPDLVLADRKLVIFVNGCFWHRHKNCLYAYEPKTRQLTYVNAGHNPPMVFRKSDGPSQVARLDVGGTVVGLLPRASYQEASFILHSGDLLVAFTDGISEAMSPEDKEWGEERMIETVKHCDSLTVAGTVKEIMRAADVFAAGAKQYDDMTLVVMRAVPPDE